MLKYKALLIVSALSIMTGFSSGYYFKTLQVDSAALKQVKVVQKATIESVDKSTELTTKNSDKKDEIQIKYVTQFKEIVKYVPATSNEKACVTDSGNTVFRVLTRDAVGVLNGSEPADTVQPATGSDAQVETLTEIGLRELSEHILKIQKQYEELAADHDTLVDYDTWYMQKTRPD